MKKIIAFVLCFLLVFTACNAEKKPAEIQEEVQASFSQFCTAFSAFDTTAAAKIIAPDKQNIFLNTYAAPSDELSVKFMQALTAYTTQNIVTVTDITIDGSTAVVHFSVAYINLENEYLDVLTQQAYFTANQKVLEMDDPSSVTEELFWDLVCDALAAEAGSNGAARFTKNFSAAFQYEESQWYLAEYSPDFLSALISNISLA